MMNLRKFLTSLLPVSNMLGLLIVNFISDGLSLGCLLVFIFIFISVL